MLKNTLFLQKFELALEILKNTNAYKNMDHIEIQKKKNSTKAKEHQHHLTEKKEGGGDNPDCRYY